MGTQEELSQEEINLRKEEILSSFNEKDKQRLESFMYATIQTMGIYSEESVKLRKTKKEGK
jgi:ABC-type metal ion transport system substrate-binding protein